MDSPAPNVAEIVAEYRRLQRQLENKTAQLDSLLAPGAQAGPFPVDFEGAIPRRYSVEFRFAVGDKVAQERSVQVASGTVFRCAAMESWLRAVGTAADPYTAASTTVQVTLNWSNRLLSFDYLWRVRDTGQDREWCSTPQPSLFGGGGYLGPLWLPRRTPIGGGTSIFVEAAPFLNQSPPAGFGSFFDGGAVSEYLLQVCFWGHEVPDTEPV